MKHVAIGATLTAVQSVPALAYGQDSDKSDEDRVEEVSVVGTRLGQAGGSVHVVGNKDLRRFSHDDPHRVLLSVPGVYVREEDGMGLRPNVGLRGTNSDRSKKVTMMEDGVLSGPAPYSAPAAYYFPLIDRMRKLRVFKGAGSIVYGPQTVGGAIDLVSREIPSSPHGYYNLALGQYGFNKQHLAYGASNERFGFVVEGMRIANSGFKELDGGGNTGFYRNEWIAKTRYVPDPDARIQNEIELKLGYSDERSNETYLGITNADFAANPYRRYGGSKLDRMKWHRTLIELTHTVHFSKAVSMKTTAYRHDLHRIWNKFNGFRGASAYDVLTQDSPANDVYRALLRGDIDSAGDAQALLIGPNDREYVSQGVQTTIDASTKTGPVRHHVQYGARAHYDEIRRKHSENAFLVQGGELRGDGRASQFTANNLAQTHALALYATDAMSWRRLIVTPGVRVEAISAVAQNYLTGTSDGATYQVVIPGASAFYGLTKNFGVLAGVHRGFSPPPPEQARFASPEKSTNYEAGARYASKRLWIEAIGFYNDYQNLTNVCTFSSGCTAATVDTQYSGGKARIFGAEVFAQTEARLPRAWKIPAKLAYTYTYSEFLTSFQSGDPLFGNVIAGDEIPYVPPHQFSATVGVEKKRAALDVSGTYVDSMRELAGQGTPDPRFLTDAYFLLGASARYRFARCLELYVMGRNLTDSRYIAARRPFGARPGAPLWIIIGIRGDF